MLVTPKEVYAEESSIADLEGGRSDLMPLWSASKDYIESLMATLFGAGV
jgi:hypothetical protein